MSVQLALRSHRFARISVLTIVSVCLTAPTRGARLYVDDDAGLGGTGATWDTAFKHLQDALAAAQANDEIRVAAGAYRPDQDEGGLHTPGDRDSHFHLINGVTIVGGYRGCPGGDCLGGDPDERDLDLYESILNGDLDDNDDPNDVGGTSYDGNCYHVVVGSGNDQTAVLDGFTIRGGNADGSAGWPNYDDSGGGLRVYASGHPTVTACTFTQNYGEYGAGAWVREADVTLSGCTFKHNRGGNGTGAYLRAAAGSIISCRFEHNTVAPFHSAGGALCLSVGCTVQARNTTFFENAMSGALIDSNSTPEFTDCDFVGNTPSSPHAHSSPIIRRVSGPACTLMVGARH